MGSVVSSGRLCILAYISTCCSAPDRISPSAERLECIDQNRLLYHPPAGLAANNHNGQYSMNLNTCAGMLQQSSCFILATVLTVAVFGLLIAPSVQAEKPGAELLSEPCSILSCGLGYQCNTATGQCEGGGPYNFIACISNDALTGPGKCSQCLFEQPACSSASCTADACICQPGDSTGYWFDQGANNISGTYKTLKM